MELLVGEGHANSNPKHSHNHPSDVHLKTNYTPTEYLVLEEAADQKSEDWNGEIVPMTGEGPTIMRWQLMFALYDSFDWLEVEGLASVEIGNEGYYGCLSYLTSDQVRTMMEKLQLLRSRNFLEVHKILHPQSDALEQNEENEAEFWQHFGKVLSYCQQAASQGNGMLLSYG